MFEIEKNVEIPTLVTRDKYKLKEMEIGDSFLAKTEEAKGTCIRAAVTYANKHHKPKMWVTRTVDGGTRLWRVA